MQSLAEELMVTGGSSRIWAYACKIARPVALLCAIAVAYFVLASLGSSTAAASGDEPDDRPLGGLTAVVSPVVAPIEEGLRRLSRLSSRPSRRLRRLSTLSSRSSSRSSRLPHRSSRQPSPWSRPQHRSSRQLSPSSRPQHPLSKRPQPSSKPSPTPPHPSSRRSDRFWRQPHRLSRPPLPSSRWIGDDRQHPGQRRRATGDVPVQAAQGPQ